MTISLLDMPVSAASLTKMPATENKMADSKSNARAHVDDDDDSDDWRNKQQCDTDDDDVDVDTFRKSYNDTNPVGDLRTRIWYGLLLFVCDKGCNRVIFSNVSDNKAADVVQWGIPYFSSLSLVSSNVTTPFRYPQ